MRKLIAISLMALTSCLELDVPVQDSYQLTIPEQLHGNWTNNRVITSSKVTDNGVYTSSEIIKYYRIDGK